MKKAVGFGADIVLAPGSHDIHIVPNAYAQMPSALGLFEMDKPSRIDPNRIWEAKTTICGRSGPWNYNVLVETTQGNCDSCERGILDAYQHVPDEMKIAAGWKKQGSVWRKPARGN